MSLFSNRNFIALFIVQLLGAFNDNLFKQALLLLLTYQGAQALGLNVGIANNLAGLLFILPFVLLSAKGGALADTHNKTRLVQAIKAFEIVIMLVAGFGFYQQKYALLFVCLALMGIHSALFGPVKYAYLPIIARHELMGANGLFQTGTSLAILLGMMVAGVLMPLDIRWIIGATIGASIIGLVASLFLQKPIGAPDALAKAQGMIATLTNTYANRVLWHTVLAISWFWLFGAICLTQSAQIGKEVLHGQERTVIALLFMFSIGVSVGSLLCRRFLNIDNPLKIMPKALALLSINSLILALCLRFLPLQAPILLALLGIGISGGLYIVPLYAYLQHRADAQARGQAVGANNIMNALFMVAAAVGAMAVFALFKDGLFWLFVLLALANGVFGAWIWSKLRPSNRNQIK